MKKDTTKERQEKWRLKQGEKGKEPLTVWISRENGKKLDILQKYYQEKSKSSLVSRIIRELENVIYSQQTQKISSRKRFSEMIKKWGH